MILTFMFLSLFQENLQKLMELQRDLVGLENLVHPDRVRLFTSSFCSTVS